MISSGGSRKVATFYPYWYLLVLYPSAGIRLVQPFALSAELKGSATQAPGGKVGGKVANKDERA